VFAVLAGARFAHFAAVALLFGLAAFPFYAVGAGQTPPRLARWLDAGAVLALVTGVLELLAIAANMGGGLGSALDPQVLSAAVTDTDIGRVWMARLALAVLVVLVRVVRRPAKDVVLLGLSGLLLASVALTGHSAMPGGVLGAVHQAADAAHLLAAGWWIGGLLALALSISAMADRAPGVLQRFSGIGYWAVAAIVATGVFKSWVLIATPAALAFTAYGQVLLVKVALFLCMGVLALSNRFGITPALAKGGDQQRRRRRLQAQVALELAIGLGVLAIVGALGAMQPPATS
jgi:putative copper resistance protein D